MNWAPPRSILPWRRFAADMADTSRRNIYFSVAAIPGHLVTAGWKGTLLLVSPSLFMLGNVVFTLGLALIKVLVVAGDRRARRSASQAPGIRAYRACGGIILLLALAYVACCLPLALGQSEPQHYEQTVALAIAVVTFAELGFSVHGFFSSRQRSDLLMEAVKLGNLAASLILLVLTQTALLSVSAAGDQSLYRGIAGIVMGTGAASIGGYMLNRSVLSRRVLRSRYEPDVFSTSGAVGEPMHRHDAAQQRRGED